MIWKKVFWDFKNEATQWTESIFLNELNQFSIFSWKIEVMINVLAGSKLFEIWRGKKKGNLVVTSTKDKRNLLLIDNICYEREGILKEALHIKAIGWRLSFLKNEMYYQSFSE